MSEEAKPKYKRPRTEALKSAQTKHDKANTIHIGLKLNRNTDADIIKRIEMAVSQGESVQGYIKSAIRFEASSICID